TARRLRATCQPSGTENRKPGPSTGRVEAVRGCEVPPQAARMEARATGRPVLASNRKDLGRMANTREKVSDAAGTGKPEVGRALRDEEGRANVRNAYESARSVYDELLGNRGVTGIATRVATDKDIQDDLRRAIADLRRAADRVQGKQERRGPGGGLILLGIVL